MNRPVKHLRRLRLALAAAVFLSFAAVVLAGFPPGGWFRTQFGSDLLAAAANLSAGAAAALLGILVLTLVCGRIYCSVLCPLGILQDIPRIFHRSRGRFLPWKKWVRLPLLLLVTGLALGGFLLPLTLLLPSSNFVIILQYAVQTACRSLWSAAHNLPEPEELRVLPAFQIAGWLLLVLLWGTALRRGRLFCNTLCPVGALLSLAARPARYRIAIAPDKCRSCGACERVCKASCIDSRGKKVDFSECVMCLDCLESCRFGALTFGRAPAPAFHPERRAFLAGAGALAGGAVLAQAVKFTGGRPAEPPVMPPGAGTPARFTASCVGCGLCISVCPSRALKPAAGEYGLAGWMHPLLDPLRGACEFNCTACSQACPCGALRPLTSAEKQSTRIGLAQLTRSRCVAWNDGEACGACGEHCPVGAIAMIDRDDITVPQVDSALCIGCGACQNICPVRPEAAIVVHGVPAQIRVAQPAAAKPAAEPAAGDFPF